MKRIKTCLCCRSGKTIKTAFNDLVIYLSTLFFLSLYSQSHGQSYYYRLTYGIDESTFIWGWNGYMKTIWSSDSISINDVLSPAQALPFAWNLYGAPVTHYKISDNGYITFDTSSSISYPVNGTLPSSGAPNKAIYAFWYDLEIAPKVYDDVVTWTYGTAPHRVHCIEWQSISPKGNTNQLNAAYFAIRIYEDGDFDIVHIWGRNNNTDFSGGTVGVENATGTDGTMTVGSPNASMKMPVVLPKDVPVYKFIYGSPPVYDMAGLNLPLPEVVKTGTSVTISGDLINYGSQTIDSLDLNYRVDFGTIQTQHITGLTISNNAKYAFTHSTPWVASGTGSIHIVNVWASNLNGNTDENSANDSVKCPVFVNLGIAAAKKALLEEFSTAPCGYCVDGLYITQNILKTYPNAVGFTHHAGYLTDAMTIPESKILEDTFGTGAPQATIDRIMWPGEPHYNVSRTNNGWVNKMITQMNEVTPVNVNISNNWNPANRQLDITVYADFVDYPYPGDLRLNAFVIEDSVTGTGSDYDQHNYYSHENPSGAFGGPTHPYYPLPYIIKGFVHRHVIRAMPSTLWGTKGVIPYNPSPSQNYSQTYHYTVPDSFKVKDLSVIAFVSYYTPNHSKLRILNTQQKEVLATGINDNHDQVAQIASVYPNPANDLAVVSFNLNNDNHVVIEVLNSVGQVFTKMDERNYSAGIHYIAFNTENYSPGVYIIRLKISAQISSVKFVVIK